MFTALALVVIGLVLLTLGADRLVLSAARISTRLGLSAILVGALVIGMGTSAPELLVSVVASLQASLDLAVGNIVGSNIANLSLVVGSAALITPVVSRVQTLRREGGVMVAGTLLFTFFAWDHRLSRLEGTILLLGMVAAGWLVIRWARADRRGAADIAAEVAEMEGPIRSLPFEIGIGLVSIAATLGGAELLVRGARILADVLGLSDGFVGLTIVAVGTSLPELATTVAAARRGEGDLVVGNVLGSNMFNSLLVGGAAAVTGPAALTGDFTSPLVAMIGLSVLAGVFARSGQRVVRWEGVALLAVFVGLVLSLL